MTQNCDLGPSSFDPNDPDPEALQRPEGWRWTSCGSALKEFGSRGVMIRLPLFWQMVPALHDVCRTIGIPLFINDASNMPLGAAALSRAGVDTVVTEARDAAVFAGFLKENALPFPKAWIVIHRANDEWHILETITANSLAQEVHSSPGIVSLSQCSELMRKKKPLFHFDTSKPDPSVFHMIEEGSCACGRPILRRI